jgi:hypothetical protein
VHDLHTSNQKALAKKDADIAEVLTKIQYLRSVVSGEQLPKVIIPPPDSVLRLVFTRKRAFVYDSAGCLRLTGLRYESAIVDKVISSVFLIHIRILSSHLMFFGFL